MKPNYLNDTKFDSTDRKDILIGNLIAYIESQGNGADMNYILENEIGMNATEIERYNN